ncbi:MAG TPA: aldo/keto reductase [Caldilineaceae bacterium]|mgnify:FL=1|nr:aldo/keto reductase [Caldilineaceae bacterium]
MEFTTLGRTGVRVSVVGMGCGGASRLGQSYGNSEEQSIAIVRRAIELGINYIDTAEAYRTEDIVGKAIAGVPRDRIVLSTKKSPYKGDSPVSAAELIAGCEASLRRLGTDYVDVYHIHGPHAGQTRHVLDELVPALQALKEQGKIRATAISEHFSTDTEHAVLLEHFQEDVWDVAMIGYNILNQTANRTVFPITQARGIGTECMFAVRKAFSRPDHLRAVLADLLEKGEVHAEEIDLDDPLGFVLAESDAANLTEAAYRFCRHEPGLDIILMGTGNIHHLETNVRSLLCPPLPAPVTERLQRIFAHAISASGS